MGLCRYFTFPGGGFRPRVPAAHVFDCRHPLTTIKWLGARGRKRCVLGWATHYIEKLRAGETVSFRPRGASMKGRIESGYLCTVAPVDCSTLAVGDIVLCRVRGAEYLHPLSTFGEGHPRRAIPDRQQSRRHQRLDRREWHFWEVHSR